MHVHGAPYRATLAATLTGGAYVVKGDVALRGVLSPLSPVTLRAPEKKAAGVPSEANYFAYAYPLDLKAQAHCHAVAPAAHELQLLTKEGGYVYFSGYPGSLVVVRVNALEITNDSKPGLRFDGPTPLGESPTSVLFSLEDRGVTGER